MSAAPVATQADGELLEHPDQMKMLVDDPSLIPGAVEECLQMYPAFAHFRRTATKDTELNGKKIKKGENRFRFRQQITGERLADLVHQLVDNEAIVIFERRRHALALDARHLESEGDDQGGIDGGGSQGLAAREVELPLAEPGQPAALASPSHPTAGARGVRARIPRRVRRS